MEGRPTYTLTRWVFLRALGVIYLIAFVSLWVQVQGLIGSGGILPAREYLDALRGSLGPERYRLVPTVFWLGAGDGALRLVCGLGVLCAALVACDVAPAACLALLWVLYLSLASVGRDFLSFQWDVLLLEAGFLAIFFAPGHVLPARGSRPVSKPALFMLWWLLFRFAFQSGVVKLTWQDPTWLHLTALDYHFTTQPLPTLLAWYAQQLPAWFKKLSVLVTYVLEMGFPFLIFGPRRLRQIACAGTVLLQVLIFATGNYNFFNLLTIALALLLLDDALWVRVLPGGGRLVARLAPSRDSAGGGRTVARVRLAILGAVFFVSCVEFVQGLSPRGFRPPSGVLAWVEPLRTVNSYGLFRVMTTRRVEIVVEGSDDGSTWHAYDFKYKPGDVTRAPVLVEPHHPRLDWQMWFAALASYEQTPWFEPFLARLLEGSPAVLGLLGRNPFPARPPKYVRALAYEYRFTTGPERRATGAWWHRTLLGTYSPPASLR